MRVASPQTRSLFSSEHNFIEALCGNNVVCKLFAGLLSIDINAQMDAITSASQFKTYCKNDTRLLCSVDADCFAPDDTHTFHIGTDSALTFVIDTLLTSDVTNYGPCVNVGGRLGTPYSPAKDFSCKWDCQGFGSYCGDGFTDVAYGEQCDDGNAIKGDGCNETCRTEAHCAYPDKSVACESDVMCPVSTVLSKTASIDPADRVCAYNNNVVFSDVSKRADYIHLFPCATDTQCQSGLAYGDETQIFTKDVVDTSPVEVSQALRTANKNLFTCKELQLLPTYEGFENTACVPDDLTPTQEQSVAPVQGAQCGNDIRDFDDKNGNKKRDAESFDDKNGNGKKDPGEVSIPAEPYIEECDISEPGTKTYDQCTGLGYNAPSCTYCSPQCTVITVESLAYCGNGIIDKIGTKSDGATPLYETCDKKPDGTVVGIDATTLQTIPINSCQDVTAPNGTQFEKGTVDCNADCTLFQNQCFSCGLLENGPIARVSLLNPMKETDTPETGIFAVMVHLNDGIASQLGFTSFVGGTTDKDFNSNIGTVRIQTNLECSIDSCSGSNCSGDGYGVLFVNHLSTFGGNNIDDAPPHDVFEYPVNGEVSAVSHEFITSPAVPSGVVRIVIRTKHDAIPEQDELFGGFYQGSHSVPLWTPLVFNLFTCNAFSGDSSPYADGKGNKYLWPIASAQHPCSGIIDLYWPHPTLKGKEHTIQSFTLDLNMLPGDEPLAFFVQSLGTNAIGAFAISTDVWVDVYTAHDGQEKYSFFKPTYTFNIKTAVDGIAFPNKDAEFWHVFSIIPDAILLLGEQEIKEAVPGIDDLWLVPVEKMETDVCDLKDNIYPGHDYCNPGT
ncbi:MAG: hypothetical protein COV60_02625 [Candidatus Magasanikbacteria bacterium CG11_big_fil_rev_8_21_14_0_20_43_7]|uniref:DUF4215 domain-containing protein n=1 Tax=Candidatus Magasanikbacteria bacterium CG11_big_fil_rev_8_21_14_0_20_43_7 TaxID=1974654 RepID=A0A2H0N265_9BACT|nr:MAG: hypothetical protein COV60_02625 [Candidatus Magasanikbacteria bacterium CG11_big_fil_rev_8_21_14_0_20_43_7]